MQTFELVLVKLSFVHWGSFNVFGEPLLELLVVVKQLWHDEMEKGPQLSHWILNRCSCQQESVTSIELQKNFPATRGIILDRLGLIKDHVIPLDFHKFGLILGIIRDEIVTCDQDMNLHGRVSQILWIQELA